MKISKRVNAIQPSLARDLFNKAKEYSNVIDLTLGDPDFGAPQALKDAAIVAINSNKTHYSANAGLKEAREAVAKNIKENWNISVDPLSEVMLTVGGMEALYLSLFSIIDEGDEVVVFAPYYMNYLQMIKALGGNPIIIDAYEEGKGFLIEEKKIREKITKKTVAVIINSPNNPTGAVICEKDLQIIAKLANEYDLTIISDEVYRTLIFDGVKHTSILNMPEAYGRTILIDSMSKEFCMTGWRIGYAYAPKLILQGMIKAQENVAACAPLPSQYAMIKAYTEKVETHHLETLQERRDFLYKSLNSIENVSCNKPQATFYLFLNIANTRLDSLNFAYQLLERKQVAVVPGIAYGENYANYVRIAFTKDIEILRLACKKMKEFILELNNKNLK